MAKLTIREHNTQTNEITDREMTEQEFAAYKAAQAESATRQAEAQAKEAAKLAILDRIGLTADELKTILG
jgi:hypothetical protein